tara:strand:+ start:2982 stop:3281 length:300 start_codon:yes stop_codon:yes gene_type:complete
MSTKEKENNILLESRGDLFGSRDKNIFHNIDKDWNVFELRVENPTSIMLTSSKYYTQLKMYFTDDIEALERLIEWTKLVQKGAKKRLKNLQKVEVESST